MGWIRGFFPNCGQLFECSFLVLLSTLSFPQRYFAHAGRDVYFFYRADIVSRCTKIYPQWVVFSFVRKNKHTDKQRNKHTFATKEKQQQTETGTISKFLVGPIHVPIHFQGETKIKKQKIKDKR